MEQLVQNATKFIKEIFQNDFSGHDFFHSMRVYRTAINIAEAEHAGMEVVALAALLHDVDDRKLSPMTAEKKENAARFMRSQNVSESEIRQVCQIIDEVSFKGTDSVRPSTPEHLKAFIRILEQAGVNVTVRRKLGSDVDASCGQLRKKVADHRA